MFCRLKSAVELVTAIVKGLAGMSNSMMQAGKTLVVGLWDGMKNNLDWLLGNVAGFANSVVDAVKEALGMSSSTTSTSTSKKGLKIGTNLMESIVLGGQSAMRDVNLSFVS